jgi:hypothetical protein
LAALFLVAGLTAGACWAGPSVEFAELMMEDMLAHAIPIPINTAQE